MKYPLNTLQTFPEETTAEIGTEDIKWERIQRHMDIKVLMQEKSLEFLATPSKVLSIKLH